MSKKIICLDAGHGGSDSGAVGAGKRYEKNDNLKQALAVGKKLTALNKDVIVKYTRTTDVYESVTTKALEGNAFGAHLFVSFHRNCNAGKPATGFEALVYNAKNTKYINVICANKIVKDMEALGFKNRGVKTRTDLAVLAKTSMPALLLEAGFINNAEDNKVFDSKFDKMNTAIAKSILEAVGLTVTHPEDVQTETAPAPVVGLKSNDVIAKEVVAGLWGNNPERKEDLEEAGYDVEEGYVCPEAIIIKGGSSIENNPLFNEGVITVQDESAMLVAPTLDLQPGDVAMDLCAAPGGKTTHIAELLEGQGKVYSFDLHENKLSLIESNIERLGLENVEVKVMDATVYNPEYSAIADKIVIDVPCSGLGIIRKKPEIKWNKTRNSLRDLIPTQREIMENAWGYLKSGGTMVYSTCTLNKEENEDNIEWFLKNHKDAEVEKIFLGNMDNLLYNKDGSLTILPNEYMDGFYIAKILKK